MRWGRVTSVSFALLEQAERQRANLDPLAFLDVVGAVVDDLGALDFRHDLSVQTSACRAVGGLVVRILA